MPNSGGKIIIMGLYVMKVCNDGLRKHVGVGEVENNGRMIEDNGREVGVPARTNLITILSRTS